MKSNAWFFLFFMAVSVFGQGVHWLLTRLDGASALRVSAVVMQIVVALGVAVLAFRRMRQQPGS